MSNEHDQVIPRMRAALDEVADSRVVAVAPAPPTGWGRQRLLAIAAAVVLVGGAVTAIAVNLSHRDSVSPAGSGDTTLAPTTAAPPAAATMPFFLAAADLPPGEVVVEGPCCLADGESVIAWARGGDLAQGLLLAHQGYPPTDVSVTTAVDATDMTVAGTELSTTSYGLTAEERAALAAQIVPGSGLPWVLPVDGWEFVGLATGHGTNVLYQKFGDSVVFEAFLDTSVLLEFADATEVRATTVAGFDGWVARYPDGTAQVVWRDANGNWMRLHVLPAAADRVDGLIAAVVPTSTDVTTDTTAVTVPTPEPWTAEVSELTAVSSYILETYDPAAATDPAVGQPIPPIRLTDGTTLAVDTPTLFVFAAHWCPHCAVELDALQQAVADGSFGAVRVVLVSTAADPRRVNYPPDSWLQEHGWTGEVLYDTSAGDGSPGQMASYFGVPGYPYLVMVNADGTVAARAAGEMPIADVVALTTSAA